MNGTAAFGHKLASAVMLLLLLGVVFLLAWELGRARLGKPAPQPPPNAVVARSPERTEPAASNNSAAAISEPPKDVGSPQPARPKPAPVVAAKRVPTAPASNAGSARLADGRELTFGGLTYGREHTYVHDKIAAGKRDAGMNTISIKTASPSLVVWLRCKAAKGSFLEADFISVIDERGREGELSNPSSIFNPAEFETVGAWQVSNFPRRDARIGIRFYSRDSSLRFHRLAEFWATNPAPRKYDTWTSHPGPINQTIGNTEFRFLSLLQDQAPPADAKITATPPYEWTTATFKVTTPSQPATHWRIESIALSDATGNSSIPDQNHFSDVGDYLVFAFNRSFWSSETVGKLRAEFIRTSGFSRNELVAFNNISIPSGAKTVTLQAQKRLGDVTLLVEGLQRHTPAVRMGDALWNLEVTASLVPPTPGMHVYLAEVRDQTGQDIGRGISHSLPNGRRSFLFHTGPQSMRLNLTFAVQKSQFVEFTPSLQKEPQAEQFTRAGLLPDK